MKKVLIIFAFYFSLSSYSGGPLSLPSGRKIAIVADYNTAHQRYGQPAFGQSLGSDYEIQTTDSGQGLLSKLDVLVSPNGLKSGDLLVISIATHGAPQVKGEILHSIVLSDGLLSLDTVLQKLKLLDGRSVKIVFIDLSCFSGPSIALGKPGLLASPACVLAGDSVGSPAVSTFGNGFRDLIDSGLSLEEAFLQARSAFTPAFSSPGLSTTASLKTNEILFKLQQIELLSNWVTYQKFFGAGPEELIQEISIKASVYLDIRPESDPALNEAYGGLNEFHEAIQTELTKYPGLKEALGKKERFGNLELTWIELASMSAISDRYDTVERMVYGYSQLTADKQRELLFWAIRTEAGDYTISEFDSYLSKVPLLADEKKAMREEVSLTFSIFNKISELYDDLNFKMMITPTYQFPLPSVSLASAERSLYDRIYRSIETNLTASVMNQDGPCSGFHF